MVPADTQRRNAEDCTDLPPMLETEWSCRRTFGEAEGEGRERYSGEDTIKNESRFKGTLGRKKRKQRGRKSSNGGKSQIVRERDEFYLENIHLLDAVCSQGDRDRGELTKENVPEIS